MERLFYQREWQQVPFQELDAVDSSPVAGRAFYTTFYQRLLSDGPTLAPDWVRLKQRVGQWLAAEFLAPLGEHRALRVFSVGAGLGLVERVLWDQDYRVDVLECEGHALQYLKARAPASSFGIVGDARALPCRSDLYDLVYLSTVDYCFDRTQYTQVLGEMRRVMRATGTVVCVCASNLALTGVMRGFAKTILKHNGQTKPHGSAEAVPWGYQRTVGEHLSAGRRAGLVCECVYLFDQGFNLRAVRIADCPHLGWPTLREAVVAVAFKKSAA